MAHAKEKPLYAHPTDYEDDFYLWLYEQAELLRLGRYDELDRPNLIEEIESLAREVRLRVEEHYRVLLFNLLRWEHRPQLRKRKWLVDIGNARREIEYDERDSQSFRPDARRFVTEAYQRAREEAAVWLDVRSADLPDVCPYTLDQLRDHGWLPGPPEPNSLTLPPMSDPEND